VSWALQNMWLLRFEKLDGIVGSAQESRSAAGQQ